MVTVVRLAAARRAARRSTGARWPPPRSPCTAGTTKAQVGSPRPATVIMAPPGSWPSGHEWW